MLQLLDFMLIINLAVIEDRLLKYYKNAVLGVNYIHIVFGQFHLNIPQISIFGEIDVNQSSIAFKIKKVHFIKHLMKD